MTTFTTLAGQPYAQALAWALLHFLWQGAVLALGAMAMFRVFRHSASARYLTGIVTLAAMLVAPAATAMWIAADQQIVGDSSTNSADASVTTSKSSPIVTSIAPVAPPVAPAVRPIALTTIVLTFWTIGVVALSVRLMGGWMTARRVARRVLQPAAPDVQAMVGRLALRLHLRRVVTVVESASVRVPIMIGWLKPLVILPAAVASGFTPDQIEALMVHELAHVRRHDYLVNLLQTMVETVLFYHPAVWWVSKCVRTEREHCCDDVAVSMCDRLVYARALSNLAEMAAPQLAMAASNGSLVERVRRILGRPSAVSTGGAGWLPVFLILTLAAPVFSAPMRPHAQTAPTAAAAAAVPIAPSVAPQTPSAAAAPSATAPAVATTTTAAAPIARAAAPQTAVATTPAAPAATPEQQRDAEIALVKARLDQLENLQRDLDQKRSALEVSKNEAQAKAQIDELRVQLDHTAQQLQRARKLEAAGLTADPPVAELEMILQKAQREIQAVQAQREYEMANAQLEAQAADQKREYERALREYSLVAGVRDNLATLANDLDAISDPSTQIRENDVLVIAVSGEPDLPASYRVQTDGTIRLPLMPPVKVTGMTAAQARDAIVNLLHDHYLANPQVQVRIRRSR